MAVKNGSLAIGIDLGTTNSCMGVWRRGGIEIIPNSLGKRTTPSYVSFSDRELHIGDAAKNHTTTDPKNIIFDAKRLIGKKFTDEPVQRDIKLWPFEVISGPDQKPMIVVSNKGERKLLSAEQITSFVLTKLQQIAKDFLGSDIKDVVITVPAYFNDSQRQATKDAGRIAGLNVLQILAEPTAAALAYGYQIKSDGVGQKNVLVFDLGGGTFDISIVSVGNGDVKVKAVGGETHFGGLNFDNNMVDHLIAEFKRKHKEDISSSPKALRKLRTACETAKMILSSDTEATIEIDSLYNKIDFEYTISRSLFEKLNQNLFSRCLEIVKECLKDANMDKKSIDDILLVGGSTRIPKVQSMLQQFFDGKELSKKINPDEAVAYGAAIHAAHLSSCKVQDMVIHDVTPLSLGTDIVGDIMGVIIPRNTTIPIKKEKFYVTSKDNQKNMSIKVYEGERSNIKDNHLLGNFTLDGIPLAPKGGVRVAVSFEIDMNGILTVTAQDKKTGKKMEKVINNEKNGLSNDQIKKMIFEVKKFKEEDKKFKKRAEARNALGSLVYDLRECIANRKNLQSKDKEGIEDEIEHTEQWINKNKNVMGDHFENEYREQLRRIAGCLKNASATSSSSHTGKKNHKATESVQHVHNFIVDMDLSPVTDFLLGP